MKRVSHASHRQRLPALSVLLFKMPHSQQGRSNEVAKKAIFQKLFKAAGSQHSIAF
jgi:hypothetical protein